MKANQRLWKARPGLVAWVIGVLVAGGCATTAPGDPSNPGDPGAVAALSSEVSTESVPMSEGSPGVTLFTNGKIYQDLFGAPVDALWVDNVTGRVAASAAGPNAVMLEQMRASGVRIVDLRGGTAIPGLQDAHGHIGGLGDTLEQVNLVGCTSFDEVVQRIVARAEQQEPGTWITGHGWDQTLWPDTEFPKHAALSRAVQDHPVLVRRVDGHAAIANAVALEVAGLLSGEPIPELAGGRVVLDDEGQPTGVLIDTAMELVSRHVPSDDRDVQRRRLLLAQEQLLSEGLVCVHDMGIGAATAELFAELEAEGLLKIRVIAYLFNGFDNYPRPEDLDPASRLRVLGAKLMVDGALGSRGAALLEPYSDAPDEVGLMRMNETEFAARVAEVAEAGLQPATHAIGDRGNRMVLDVYARRMQEDPSFAALRPRVEHAQVVSESDWARFDELGVTASMQPTHATSDMRWAEQRLGADRVRGAYAWRRLHKDVRQLAFGSDFPVEPSNPMEGIYAACTRQDPSGEPAGGWMAEQSLSVSEAITAFSAGAARAVREEDTRGLLHNGYFADMTVLNIDPMGTRPASLLDAEVLMTIIEGEIVYDRDR